MNKALRITKNILTVIILIVAVGIMLFTIVSTAVFDRGDRDIFGYKAFIVRSDSMSKTDFSAGDLILVKEVEPKELVVGDIITFQSTNKESYGEIVTHKIRELTKDREGNPGFITYGTTTDTDDEAVVTYGFVLGKYKTALPGVGRFFGFLKTTPGYIACIFIPFLLLILMQVINSISLFRRYKGEQQALIDAEKSKIEAQLAETERMRAELEAMKAQIGMNTSPENRDEQKEKDSGGKNE